MTDTTHDCPAPACTERVPFERFACKGHWFRIPEELRHRLVREWRRNPGEASYFEARAECLAALGVPDGEISAMNGGVSRREALPQ